MADAVETITKLINSPPGQLAAGGVLAGIVWKFFERVETVLNEDTKLEIAVWLLERKKVSSTFESWPNTFAKVFDRVFGEKHLSWRCFGRSCLATLTACIICAVGLTAYLHPSYAPFPGEHPSAIPDLVFAPLIGVIAAVFLCVFDYLSLLETRFALGLLRRWSSWYIVLIVLVADVIATGVTGGLPADVQLGLTLHPFRTYSQAVADEEGSSGELKKRLEQERSDLLVQKSKLPEIEKRLNELNRESSELTTKMRQFGFGKSEKQKAAEIDRERFVLEGEHYRSRRDLTELEQEIAAVDSNQKSGFDRKRFLLKLLPLWLPTFFTSIWLWLYAGSGFILKAARRFDVGFAWFNRHFDIEKKPLQSIGLVAGALVAVVYWGAVVVSRII